LLLFLLLPALLFVVSIAVVDNDDEPWTNSWNDSVKALETGTGRVLVRSFDSRTQCCPLNAMKGSRGKLKFSESKWKSSLLV